MKTILVPTDFSENAGNAARYAMKLAPDLNASNIVFYNAYQAPPVLTETTVPAMPLIDMETFRGISENSMVEFQKKMQLECPVGIELEHKTEFSVLTSDINEICKSINADLIVMGITGTSKIEEVLIGSTAINVMKETKVPVIIVPSEAKYNSLKNVVIACNFKDVLKTTPVQLIKSILDTTGASLHIVNVIENNKELTEDKSQQKDVLQSLLQEYNPQIHLENNDDFIEGINHFVDENSIDLVITIPRKHKIFEGLFKERHTKQLAFHSHVPLMYIHQEDL